MTVRQKTQPRSAGGQPLRPATPAAAEQFAHDIQAVNEQLLIAGLRDHVWADQLHDQLTFTRAITRSLGEGLYALDCVGQFTLVNPAAEQILGWAESDLLGKQVDAFIPMQTAQGITVVWEKSLLREVIHTGTSYRNVDVVLTRCDGTSFPATYSAAPIVVNDQVVGVAVGLRDMTEVQRLRQIQEAYLALMSREHTQLEAQVQERTSELERANARLHTEINERKRTEQARQHLLQQLVTAQEEERRRIARELHDQMGQRVTELMFAIKVLHDHVGDASDLQRHVAELHTLGSQLGQDVRTLAVQLRPPALDDFGLLPTLTTYIEQWSTQALVAADLHSTGFENTRLPQMIETTVFRVVQEALTNIMRHAQATSVSVIMHRRADALQLIVEDDGIGFDARLERQRPYVERRLGLMGMEERVAQLAGTLTIESTPGSGTTLFVSLPLARAAQKGPVVTLQIFLADDHLVVREGLKTLINAQHDMCVIGEASDGQTVVQQARDCQPDLVIMDISMPKMNGVQATAALKRACPDIKVLALSAHEDVTYLRELLAVGASGYLLKHAAADTLIQAIHQVAAGGLYLEPSLSKHVVARFVRVPAANDMLGADLSERETEVAQRVAQGYSNQDIANQLVLSVKTVETYRGRAMKKLGLESRAALVRYALEHGWLRAS